MEARSPGPVGSPAGFGCTLTQVTPPVRELVDRSDRCRHRGTRPFYPPGHLKKGDHGVACVAHVVDIEAELVEVLFPLAGELPQTLRSVVLSVVRPLRHRVDDGVRCGERDHPVDSLFCEGLEGAAHDLHVLLRHRLLRPARRLRGPPLSVETVTPPARPSASPSTARDARKWSTTGVAASTSRGLSPG